MAETKKKNAKPRTLAAIDAQQAKDEKYVKALMKKRGVKTLDELERVLTKSTK